MIAEYGLFLAKSITATLIGLGILGKKQPKELTPTIKLYNETFYNLQQKTLKDLKGLPSMKTKRTLLKKTKKSLKDFDQHLFVLDFRGDIKATGVKRLRQEIDLILSIASENDKILVRLDSRGGTVTGYGLASAQLQRIRDANIHLTISIDEVAASGGYMMASLANDIISSPYATIGSIGVAIEVPNFNQLLSNYGIEWKQVTAGKYKRTISQFGPSTPEGDAKAKEDIEAVHELFRQHVSRYRNLDLETVATGETWPAMLAEQKGLVDRLYTSDAYIQDHLLTHAVLIVSTPQKQGILQGLKSKASTLINDHL